MKSDDGFNDNDHRNVQSMSKAVCADVQCTIKEKY